MGGAAPHRGSSWTYTRIDDYWGFDPKCPDNRLPYSDTVEYLIVNDPTAITALMRSGQADFIGFGLNSHLTSVDSAVNLQKTNPDLVLHPYATPSFWPATIILVFPAIWWGWSPPLRLVRLSADPVRHFSMFIVPGLILGTYLAASTAVMVINLLVDVLYAYLDPRAHYG